MTEPMTDARLAEIDAYAAQYREKRAAAQNALIDHDRNEVLRQEAYAGSIAQVLAEEAVPEMAAEIRRLRAENGRLDTLADNLAQALAESDADAGALNTEIADLRARLAAKEA